MLRHSILHFIAKCSALVILGCLLAQSAAVAEPGQAATFKFYPALFPNMPEKVNCPSKIQTQESNAPYREGGYEIYGSADFSSFAGPFQLIYADPFTVIWQARLKPLYAQCQGTAVPQPKMGDQDSHLRLKFLKGKVELVLDMSGVGDANGYTTGILYGKIKNGMPIWGYSGSD